MDAGVFLSSISVQVGANQFKAVQYLAGIALFSFFKQQVLDKMCKAFLVFGLIARAGVPLKTAMSYG